MLTLFGQSYKWLFAEMTVVILGILIAFQLDEWQNDLTARQVEARYLTDMLDNLRLDEADLMRAIDDKSSKLPALRKLVVMLDSDEELDGGALLALEEQSYRGGTSIFRPVTATFDKMIRSGELVLVQDSELYNAIVDYYQRGSLSGRDSQTLLVDWLGRWRSMQLELYGPLSFIQWWESGPIPNNSQVIYRPEEEQLVERRFDVSERRANEAYMTMLADHYQQWHYYEIRAREKLASNRLLQASIARHLAR